MKKYIHYFVDSDKTLPQFSKKCLDSWLELLPNDYELKMWTPKDIETINDCSISKEIASLDKYNIKKDFIKVYSLYKYGGIFVDQNIKLIRSIDDLLQNNKSVLGLDERHDINTSVWYEKEKKGKLISKAYNKFINNFPEGKYNDFFLDLSIILRECIEDYNPSNSNTQKLNDNIVLLSREYFNPYSYNGYTKYISKNTRTINYIHYDFITPKGKVKNFIYDLLGNNISKGLFKIFSYCKKMARIIMAPLLQYKKMKKKNTVEHNELINTTLKKIDSYNKKDYIALHNPEFTGVSNATIELFKYCVPCGELINSSEVNQIANSIIDNEIKQVILSGFCIGWYELAIKLSKHNIIVKTYFHGSHSQYLDEYGWKMNTQIFELERKGIVKEMAFCKESLINFYKDKGCNVRFLRNIVNIDFKPEKKQKNKELRVGVYAVQTTNWLKNVFSSLSSIALLKKELKKEIIVDIVPKAESAESFMHILGIKTDGIKHAIPREDLLRRMSKCDINLYVTFTECAPMLPLESFYVGVPCITGNNHHYFKNTKLDDYLVVSNENNPKDISKKIIKCLENKKKVLELYDQFSKNNLEEGKKIVKKFIGGCDKNE